MKSSEIWFRRAGLLVAAALFLVGNLVFFFAYGTDSRSREQALENRRKALEQEVATAEAEASRLAAQRDRLAQVSSALEEFYGRRIGPRRDTLAPVVEEVHALLRRAGIAPAQIGYKTASVPDLPLSEMLVSFSFRSDYATFKRLLQLLESNQRWILVRDAALARDAETPGSVEVRLVLATYFSGEEGAAPRIQARGRVGA
jgi:Tfp pilus assembly protein PilO